MKESAGKIPSFIEHHEILSSTNDRAWELLLKEGKDSDRGVIIADFQEKGRGRAGRSWCAEKSKALLMSFILIPEDKKNLPLIPLASGLSVIKALNNCAGVETKLKWPNDILFENKKMGGILTETKTLGSELLGVVVGIGLNIEGGPEVFPVELQSTAVTLETSSSKSCDRDMLLKALFDQLNYYIDLCFSKPWELVEELSEAWAHRIGDPVKVSSGECTLEGTFAGISASGELILRTGSGDNKIIQGEILEIGENS